MLFVILVVILLYQNIISKLKYVLTYNIFANEKRDIMINNILMIVEI